MRSVGERILKNPGTFDVKFQGDGSHINVTLLDKLSGRSYLTNTILKYIYCRGDMLSV